MSKSAMVSSPLPPAPLRGEVWYVRIPSQPNDPHQPRTAVILSSDIRNTRRRSIVVVPTSSTLEKSFDRIHVFLPKGVGGLPKDCWALCDLITTVDKALLSQGPLGPRVTEKYLYPMTQCIRFVVGDPDV